MLHQFFLLTKRGDGCQNMNRSEAEKRLREVARFGTIGLSKHCRKRMEERNVSMDDIVNVLSWGVITDIEDVEDDALKCEVKGTDIEGDDLTFVAILSTADNVVCVTVF
jgi:hypothetical protein